MRVLWDGRISEIFVPYHDGSPRYYDVTNFTFNLTSVSAADCPAQGGGSPIAANVCKEVRDRGLLWKDYALVRRGQELSLWGALGAGNYNYVMEWIFRDDGMLIGRVGATAVNLPSKPLMTHVHNPMWRLDVDLNGASGDSAAEMIHTESGLNGIDNHALIRTEQRRRLEPAGIHRPAHHRQRAEERQGPHQRLPAHALERARRVAPPGTLHPAGHVGDPLQMERDGCALPADLCVAGRKHGQARTTCFGTRDRCITIRGMRMGSLSAIPGAVRRTSCGPVSC